MNNNMKHLLTFCLFLNFVNAFGQSAMFSTSPAANNNTITICQGSNILYTNTSAGTNASTIYNWTFQGGSLGSSNQVGPHLVTYSNTGSFTSTLNLSNGNSTQVNVNVVANNFTPALTIQNSGQFSTTTFNGVTIFRRCGNFNSGNFTFTDPNFATYPAGTTFSYSWGDGTSGSGNPTSILHSYVGQGYYPLTYSVTFPSGCTFSVNYQVYVGGNPPAITLSGSGSASCLPNPYSFTLGTPSTPSVGTVFQIIYNDGTPTSFINSLSPNPLTINHVFNQTSCGINSTIQNTTYSNSYAIQVVATNGCNPQGTFAVLGPISAGGSVNANITANPNTNVVCVNSPVTFQDASNHGTNVFGGSCDSIFGRYWTISPNSGFTAVGALGSSNGFLPNSGVGYDWTSWTNGAQNLPVTWSVPGNYQVTLHLGNDCGMDSVVYNITVNGVDAGPNQSVCAGTAVTLTGAGSQNCTWNNGVVNGVPFIPLTTQTYTLTGTNTNGCAGIWNGTDQVTVTVNPLPTVSAGNNQSVCAGSPVTLSGSGASTYSWNNGVQNGVPFTPNATQTYTVTGTDANGCSNTAQVTLTLNPIPTVSAGSNQTVCAGTQVTLSGSGAVNYSWNNGVINGTSFTPLTTQTYTVTGTNANGCSNTAQVTVTVNPSPNISGGNNQSICIGSPVTLSGSGATNYTWNNGVVNGTTFTPLATQTYTVTGTNANGCSNTAQVTVTVNPLPTVSAGSNQSVCVGTPVTLIGSGANTYSWTNGVANATPFIPMGTQIYTVTGTNANGCSNTAQVTVTVNPSPNVSAGSNQSVCAGSPVTLSGSGASSYTWSNGISDGVAFVPVATQLYTVTGTANGCSNTAQVTVTVNPSPNVSAGADQSICVGEQVILSASGGNTYNWNNNVVNGQAFSPNQTADYMVTGIDLNGCTGMDTVSVAVLQNSVSTLTQTALDSYTLNGQTYTQSGTYTQTVPAANGCDSTITLNLTLNFTGLDELGTGAKKLVKITDLNGKIIPRRKNTLMIFIYEDGTVERVVEMEE
ncbi:MAG: hypothetical protein EBR91_03140 [Flavobacteriia bacterium]|nr:hypothetical protein [Flavobacteriia bacterium]